MSGEMKEILIVLENKEINDSMKSRIESLGYRAVQMFDPLEVFDRIKSSPPDLVIVDIFYKYIDGLYLIEKLRAQSDGSPPVLLVSSENDSLLLIDSLEKGASDYVVNPLISDKLAEKIRKLLKS